MQLPSLTLVLSTGFVCYILHSMWALSQLFSTLSCSETPCYTSFLATNPKLQLALFTSPTKNPIGSEVTQVASFRDFDYREEISRYVGFMDVLYN